MWITWYSFAGIQMAYFRLAQVNREQEELAKQCIFLYQNEESPAAFSVDSVLQMERKGRTWSCNQQETQSAEQSRILKNVALCQTYIYIVWACPIYIYKKK